MGAPYALSSDLVSAWPAKSLEVAQYIDGQLPLIAMTQNAQTGTTYTLAATDFTKLVTLSNASQVTVTVPLESSVPWVAGTQLRLMNLGAGLVTVAGAVGVTINGSPLTLAQYKGGTLTKTGTNDWVFTPYASGLNTASAVKLDTFSTASTSFVDVTGMSVTITPSSTAAKVLVIVTLGLVANGSTAVTRFNLVRDATTIAQPTGGTTPSTVNFLLEATGVSIPGPISFVDSPASAAATTYKLQMAATSSTSYVNRRAAGGFETISHIFAMEVPA